MTTQTRLQAMACEARSYFIQHTRSENDVIWTTKDGHPSWVRDLCFDAHDSGGMLPDDWRYAFLVEALDALSESEDPDDIALEPDIYTHDLCAWLGSRADRYSYCDQAIEDTGGEIDNTISLLQLGQAFEKREVLDSVRSFLESRIEETEDEDEDEDTEDMLEGPEDDDYVTSDRRRFYVNRKPVLTVGEDEDWRAAVRAHMDAEQFWPNVWLEEERGGYTLLSLDSDDPAEGA